MEKDSKSILFYERVFAVQWAMDSSCIMSGSDDMNIRLWKTIAYKPLGNVYILYLDVR